MDNVQATKKVMKVLFYTSAAVVGWQPPRYFYGRPLTSADLGRASNSSFETATLTSVQSSAERTRAVRRSLVIQAAHHIRNER